jgi:hypothetical protein
MKRIIAVAAAIACAASLAAFANDESTQPAHDKAQIRAEYKDAKQKCEEMSGRERTTCRREAKEHYQAALKQAKAESK